MLLPFPIFAVLMVVLGTRKALSQGLANFVPSLMQNDNQIAARLELFRTQTLAGFEPVDKKKQAANAEMDELLDETLGLQNIVLPHLDIARSRAGLYVYLNAAVSSRSTSCSSRCHFRALHPGLSLTLGSLLGDRSLTTRYMIIYTIDLKYVGQSNHRDMVWRY